MTGLVLAQAAAAKAPKIDWAAISPLVALAVGAVIVLLLSLVRSRLVRTGVVPALAAVTFAVAIGLCVWQWGEGSQSVVSGALRIDDLSLGLTVLFCAGGIGTVAMSVGSVASEDAGHGEFHALLLASVMGMVVLAGAEDLVALFIGFELLSIPLYVLCATELRRATSLESGLKYLIIGSVGSAVLLYGLALIYGATGATGYRAINDALTSSGFSSDVLLLTGVALALTGLAFKASIAPFHQWTPDVYEGAPTAITGFMAVATKAAAFGVLLRLFDVALISAASTWAPILAVLATITIVVGNVGALGQSSVKRLLAFSSVAQAGYMLAGVVVSTQLGVSAVAFYLAGYLLMNIAAFAVVSARERELGQGDSLASLNGLATQRPVLGWSMSIAMLALAGWPATAGFVGKIYLIQAAVDNGYAWLGVVIVLGAALSLAYYLRVIAAVWTRDESAEEHAPARMPAGQPVMAGGAARADEEEPVLALGADSMETGAAGRHQPLTVVTAAVCTVGTIFFGVFPQPLFDVATDAGRAFMNLL